MKAKIGENNLDIDYFSINKNIGAKNISIAIKTNEEIEEFTLSGKTVEFDGIIYYNNIELISISYNDILDQYVIICKEEPIDDYS